MLTAKVSSSGQITLPPKVRQALAVKPGGRVQFVVNGDRVLPRPAGPASARALAGSLRRFASSPQQPSRVRTAVKREVTRAADA